MRSQPGLQTIAIHILPNISQNQGNQAMKFGQLLEYKQRKFFLKNDFFKKRASYQVKASDLQLSFNIFR